MTTAEAPTQLNIEPDRYLDLRRAEWSVHEVAGQIRYAREVGQRRATVVVDEGCLDVLEVLTG